jgi:Protein of unknown function, DUF547
METIMDITWRHRLPLILLGVALLVAPACGAPGIKTYSDKSYAAILTAHVDAKGNVDYPGLRKAPARLDAYLDNVARLDRAVFDAWSKEARIAFLVNAYNAITLKSIIAHAPVKSIRDIEGVWKKKKWAVLGDRATLDYIEHSWLRKDFSEPRIHFGLVCASIGCPLLRAEPFTGKKLGPQLDEQAKRFFADGTKFRVDRAAARVHISPLFDWFGKDFVKGHLPSTGFGEHSKEWRAVLNFASKFASKDDRAFLEKGAYEIVLLEYDWRLNGK